MYIRRGASSNRALKALYITVGAVGSERTALGKLDAALLEAPKLGRLARPARLWREAVSPVLHPVLPTWAQPVIVIYARDGAAMIVSRAALGKIAVCAMVANVCRGERRLGMRRVE